MNRVPRLAATLAGLAMVGIPAAIAMANADHASRARPEQTLMQPARSTTALPRHDGRPCHHRQGTDSTSTATPDV
ncbi:MAG: hypothetical protein E6G10_12050 [Actinobacteria bacterium]|nr:MAG: hypothetical protein E6G10_12050 [Actinomycetota bacterium]